jgi:predicted transcriptional regulator
MKGKPRGVIAAGSSVVPEATVKLSVNVSADVGMRLRRFAFEERLSESSIVEIALNQLFARNPSEATLAKFLREHGASLRRRARSSV